MRCWQLVLIGLTCSISASTCPAQPVSAGSHAHLDGADTVTVNPLNIGGDRDIFKDLFNDPSMRKRIEALSKSNPQALDNAKQQLREILKNNPAMNRPEVLEHLKSEMVKMLDPQAPKSPFPWESLRKNFDSGKQSNADKPPPSKSETPNLLKDGTNEAFARLKPPPTMNAQRTKALRNTFKPNPQTMRWLERNLGDRPEVAGLIDDVNQALSRNDWQRSDAFQSLEKELQDFGNWIGKQDIKLPDFSVGGARLPTFDLTLPNVPAMPGVPSAPATPSGGSLLGLLPILAFGLAFVWWRLVKLAPDKSKVKEAFVSDPNLEFDPQAIRDAGEFVAAYQKWSVRTLGTSARQWNHRTISQAIEIRYPEQTSNIESLTALYEKARYTEGFASLSESELQAVRSQLQALLENAKA